MDFSENALYTQIQKCTEINFMLSFHFVQTWGWSVCVCNKSVSWGSGDLPLKVTTVDITNIPKTPALNTWCD